MPSKLLRSAVIDTELHGPFLFNPSFTLHSSFDCTAILPEKSDSKLPKQQTHVLYNTRLTWFYQQKSFHAWF